MIDRDDLQIVGIAVLALAFGFAVNSFVPEPEYVTGGSMEDYEPPRLDHYMRMAPVDLAGNVGRYYATTIAATTDPVSAEYWYESKQTYASSTSTTTASTDNVSFGGYSSGWRTSTDVPVCVISGSPSTSMNVTCSDE